MLQHEQRADRKSRHEWLYSGAGRRFLQLCVQELRSLVIGNIPFKRWFHHDVSQARRFELGSNGVDVISR